MATFVLVPGGWRGGWYFHNLAEALRARGHRAYAAQLTGVGERRLQPREPIPSCPRAHSPPSPQPLRVDENPVDLDPLR